MKKPSWLDEFKVFISRGNVIDLAVGVVVGGAFTAIVTALVNDIINPLISLIIGGLDFSGVTFMDSSGIAVALRGWQRMRELGGTVLLRHVSPQPRKVFEASGVNRMMTIE